MSIETLPLLLLWRSSNEDTRITFLRELAIPFPANEPVESAKQALLNLTDLEWIEVCDWLQEINWLPS